MFDIKSFYFSLHDLLLDTSIGAMTLFCVGFFPHHIYHRVSRDYPIEFWLDLLMGHLQQTKGDFSTGLWHDPWMIITLLLFYTKLNMRWTGDFYLIFLRFVSAVISSSPANKIPCSSGEVVCTTRLYHPDIDAVAASVSQVLSIFLCTLI